MGLNDIDKIISVEIPDANQDKLLYDLVTTLVIHGPCGIDYESSPCMQIKKCMKRFPKKFADRTYFDEEGYPIYKRRDTSLVQKVLIKFIMMKLYARITIVKKGKELDNRNVVPYNATLLKRYNVHINVEWCNESNAIKYLFKYINKGPDCVTAKVRQARENGVKDEIEEYLDYRYISACEAAWSILGFKTEYKRLRFHLEGEQSITYKEDETLDEILDKVEGEESMFMQWFHCNYVCAEAESLTYNDFPLRFT